LDLHIAGSGHARLFQFLFLLALEGFFDVADGGRDLPLWASMAQRAHSVSRPHPASH
jgi:hypothetical protein